jgi:hypothetical protein
VAHIVEEVLSAVAEFGAQLFARFRGKQQGND